jgi:hypothetical protein
VGWTTLSQFAEDFRVFEFSIFDNPDASGWNVGLTQPVGKLFLKCEIYRYGLNGLGIIFRNASKENDEKQTQRQLLCGYAVHRVKTFSVATALTKVTSGRGPTKRCSTTARAQLLQPASSRLTSLTSAALVHLELPEQE